MAAKSQSETNLQIARLNRFPVVFFCSTGSVFEKFFDFLIERIIEVRSNVLLVELSLHGGFDY